MRIFIRRSALLLTLVVSIAIQALDLKPIQLPVAQTEGGRPLMQVLANLLWAAFGINRPDGGRTAPSEMNWQEIDVYVAMDDGLFLYKASEGLAKVVRGSVDRAALAKIMKLGSTRKFC